MSDCTEPPLLQGSGGRDGEGRKRMREVGAA
jgi:hypothetical protein